MGNRKENALIKQAVRWFYEKKPQDLTIEEHLENPTLNTKTESERELAKTVAHFLEYSPTANKLRTEYLKEKYNHKN